MKLSKGIIALIIVLGVVFLIFMWGKNGYNKMVSQEEQVTTA